MSRLVRAVEYLAIAAMIAACGRLPATTGSSASATSGAPSMAPVGAVARAGPFRLTFELPGSTWPADRAITGQATLSIDDLRAPILGGSGGGLIGFDYEEVGGRRHVEPVWTADCAPHPIGPADPIVEPLGKSGGYDAADPDADFYRSFLRGTEVRLPPGTWRVTAIATFTDGRDCDGRAYDIRAPITITVLP